jgi:two-component system OmpR family sensor kinase
MSGPLACGRRAVVRSVRGVRGRLVATYLLAAVILAVAGVALFTLALGHGLRTNVDAALRTRAATVATDVAAGNLEQTTPPRIVATSRTDLLAFTAIYAPGGTLVDAQPATLPQSPLTSAQLGATSPATTIRTMSFGGESFRIVATPVPRSDGTWFVVAGESLAATTDASTQVQHALFIAVPVLLFLVGIGAWLLSGGALRPVDRMAADAQDLSEHDPTGRITEPATDDSLNHLARTFNGLLDRLHHSLDRQRSLVADAGHELRTPLAVLQTELETALRPNRSRADLVDSITHARVEVTRLASLSEDLLLLAQADGAQPIVRRELTDVSELLDDVVRAHRDRADLASVALCLDRPAPLIAELDPVALRRILDNLLANALRHTPAGGAVTLYAGIAPDRRGVPAAGVLAADAQIVLRIGDTGPGFPTDFLPRAFDRFTRGDQGRSRSTAAAGSGLGLAIVATLVHAHAGSVIALNGAEGGAIIEIQLPAGHPGTRSAAPA